MALNIPGMTKIDEILKKVSAKLEDAPDTVGDGLSHHPMGLIGLLKASISLKFMLAAALLLFVSLIFLLSAGFKVVNSANEYNHVEFTAPVLEDYIPTLKSEESSAVLVPNEEVDASEKESTEKQEVRNSFQLDKDVAINKAFDFLAKFENKRSYKTLISIRPVISNIKRSSPADDGELQVGDTILKVNGAPIESVLGFYLATTDKPTMELALEVERRSKVLMVKLLSNTNSPLSSSTIGISFVMPAGVVYITADDAKKLSNQYQESFLNSIPIDRQKLFANNLLRMAQKISNQAQVLTLSNTPGEYPISKLKTSEFLQWQHQKFMDNMDQFYQKRRDKEGMIFASLSNLGDALTGVAAAMMAFICAVLYYVIFSRK